MVGLCTGASRIWASGFGFVDNTSAETSGGRVALVFSLSAPEAVSFALGVLSAWDVVITGSAMEVDLLVAAS